MTAEDREEIKRHFDVVAEGLRSESQMLAEAVAMNTEWLGRHNGRFDRLESELQGLRDEMRHGFSELRSLYGSSQTQCDARLATIEDGHSDIEKRLERVETKLAS